MMPPEPGEYLISYVAAQERKVLASIPVTVTPVAASLMAPASASVGSELEISWDGPNYQNDYISIAKPDDDRWESYT